LGLEFTTEKPQAISERFGEAQISLVLTSFLPLASGIKNNAPTR
jgi:hypothetical protein